MWPDDLRGGASRIIEAARTDKQGRDLVDEFLTTRPWLRRRKTTLVREAAMAIVFNEYARTGTLRIPLELNDLDLSIGLREIKAGPGRFPFYEITDQKHPLTSSDKAHPRFSQGHGQDSTQRDRHG
ncbi:MAG: hypothetical protein M3Y33_02960 [Actinomycetota bacterium]|nr:hypothetical protein [Actinomycetota bacterium]